MTDKDTIAREAAEKIASECLYDQPRRRGSSPGFTHHAKLMPSPTQAIISKAIDKAAPGIRAEALRDAADLWDERTRQRSDLGWGRAAAQFLRRLADEAEKATE